MHAWIGALLLLGSLSVVATASAQSPAAPVFSATDRQIIARNALLSGAVKNEPAVVRRALDALAKLDEGQMRAGVMLEGSKAGTTPQKRPGEPPSKNPDLDRLERASPEALDDLFQLLKQASRPKPGTKR